jgi:hypothetical protein
MRRPLPRQPQDMTVPMGPGPLPVPLARTVAPPYYAPPRGACSPSQAMYAPQPATYSPQPEVYVPQQALCLPPASTFIPHAGACFSPPGAYVPCTAAVVPDSSPVSTAPDVLAGAGVSEFGLGAAATTRKPLARRTSCLRTHSSLPTAMWIAFGSFLGAASLVALAALVMIWPAFCGLRLKPIQDVVCRSGDRITKQFQVEHADFWGDRIEYRVHVSGSGDARCDRKTGRFVWHPDRPGRYNVTVTARKTLGLKWDQKSFSVLVRPR